MRNCFVRLLSRFAVEIQIVNVEVESLFFVGVFVLFYCNPRADFSCNPPKIFCNLYIHVMVNSILYVVRRINFGTLVAHT